MGTPPEYANGTNKIKHQPQKTKHLLNKLILHNNLHTNLHFPSTTLLALKYKYYNRIMCMTVITIISPYSYICFQLHLTITVPDTYSRYNSGWRELWMWNCRWKCLECELSGSMDFHKRQIKLYRIKADNGIKVNQPGPLC